MNKFIQKLSILFALISLSNYCFAQGDNPCSAVTLTANASCTYVGGTTAGATYSNNAANGGTPTCAVPGAPDVWYKFTAAVSGNHTFDSNTGTITDSGMSLYSATTCSTGLTQLTCDDDGSANGTMSMITYSLTAGTTYYIRFWKYSSGTGTFSICLTSPPTPPANDNCPGAIALTVNADLNCGVQTGGTILGATTSTQANVCSGTADDDVWYSFVATSTTHSLSLTNVAGSTTDLYHSVYNGGTCGALGSTVVCSDPNSSSLTGLTIGNTYRVRVYSWTSTTGQTSTFSVCVGTPPSPPANDNCPGAIALTVNTDLNCGTQTGGTLQSATTSTQSNVCGGTADDDVWYSFVATSTSHSVALTNIAGSTTDMYFSVYNGGTCGALGSTVVCSDPNSSLLTGLTVGNTYRIRAYSWTSTTGQNTTFSVCVGTPPPPPSNDNCPGAIALTVNPDYNCGTQTGGTLQSATTSTQTNSCGGTADDDVWYSFVATSTSHSITLTNIAGSTTDMYFSVYNGGTCGALGSTVVCSDPNSSLLTGLTVGNTYRVRVYSWTSTTGQNTTFSVCVGTPPPPPANDNCPGAYSLTVNSNFACGVQTGGTLQSATTSTQTNVCGGTADDDVWFKFTATNTSHSIDLLNVAGSTTDLYHSVYNGGTCGALGSTVVCSDPNSSSLTGLTVGNTYWVRVYSWTSTTGQTSTFSVCVGTPPPPPSNDNCPGATTLAVNPMASPCGTITAGTIASASTSTNTNGCGGTADDDVWFSFVATSTAHTIDLLNITGSTTDLYHAVYDGGTCNALGASVICSDPNSSSLTGLTIGNTYRVRVYSWTSTTGQTSSFNICVNTPGPCGNAQTNDYCSNPATLTQGAGTFSSTTSSTYTDDEPGNLSTEFCGSIENNSWYKFTATATTASFPITSVSGCANGWGVQAEVYAVTTTSIGCCTAFTSVSNCFNPGTASTGTVTATGLTIGNDYILMFDGNAGDVCAFTVSNWTATGILPIELLSFTGKNIGKENLLEWITTWESNNDYFTLEHSSDGIFFETITTVNGAGNSNSKKEYSATDPFPFDDITYYRLKQTDYDKKSKYSDVISIDMSKYSDKVINVHPNPALNSLFVDVYTKTDGVVNIEIYSYTGNIIMIKENRLEKGIHSLDLNLENVSQGVYLMKVSFEKSGKSYTQKIIKN